MKINIRGNKAIFKHNGKVIKKFKRGKRYWGNEENGAKELALYHPEMAVLSLLEGDWKIPYADVVEAAYAYLVDLENDGFIDGYSIDFPVNGTTELTYKIAGVKTGLTIRRYDGGARVDRITVGFLSVEEALRIMGNKNWEQLDHNVFLVKYSDKETWLLAGDLVLSVVCDEGKGEIWTYMFGGEDQSLHLGKTPVEALLAFELHRARPARRRQGEVIHALLKHLCKGKDIVVSMSDNGGHASYLVKFPKFYEDGKAIIITAEGLSSGDVPDANFHFRVAFSCESSFNHLIKEIRESK